MDLANSHTHNAIVLSPKCVWPILSDQYHILVQIQTGEMFETRKLLLEQRTLVGRIENWLLAICYTISKLSKLSKCVFSTQNSFSCSYPIEDNVDSMLGSLCIYYVNKGSIKNNFQIIFAFCITLYPTTFRTSPVFRLHVCRFNTHFRQNNGKTLPFLIWTCVEPENSDCSRRCTIPVCHRVSELNDSTQFFALYSILLSDFFSHSFQCALVRRCS